MSLNAFKFIKSVKVQLGGYSKRTSYSSDSDIHLQCCVHQQGLIDCHVQTIYNNKSYVFFRPDVGKRKKEDSRESKLNKKLKTSNYDESFDTGLSLKEDEELVLKFLSNNKL